eukprot:PhF_6_TR15489/c0_g1_i1/m.24097/K08869/ADCK, ABC1; aarF domain-containing kinase
MDSNSGWCSALSNMALGALRIAVARAHLHTVTTNPQFHQQHTHQSNHHPSSGGWVARQAVEPKGLSSLQASLPGGSVARAALFSMLAVRLAANYATRPKGTSGLTVEGHNALVDALCHMRGAALKLAQMLSLQDDELVPQHVLDVFAKVRDSAVCMPTEQLHKSLHTQLGAEWEKQNNVTTFREIPFAAASIGQVHYLIQGNNTPLAMKVQFPGVATSVHSDVANLKRLSLLHLLPKGLFVDRILNSMEAELSLECDYSNEAAVQTKYRGLLQGDLALRSYLAPMKVSVPEVIPELSTKSVLTSTFCQGVAVDKIGHTLPQRVRDDIGKTILFVTLKELFHWRFMQTDPNYSNFLYDKDNHEMHLVDFGAARPYHDNFVSTYHNIVSAGVSGNAEEIIRNSVAIQMLTGEENRAMMNAHCESVKVIAKPFSSVGSFDFGEVSISSMLIPHVKIMIQNRICPPPLEVYSLHRRLSGAYLLCTRLGSRVNVQEMWSQHFAEKIPALMQLGK